MKKYKLNERGKLLVMTVLMFAVVIVGTIIYLDRIEKISNGTMTVQCDCGE